jgi:hypothetical protein
LYCYKYKRKTINDWREIKRNLFLKNTFKKKKETDQRKAYDLLLLDGDNLDTLSVKYMN